MNIVLQSGIYIDDEMLSCGGLNGFYLEELEQAIEPYYYPGSSLRYDLDGALVELYDTFQHFFFHDINQYYSESCLLPFFSVSAGYDSDITISVDVFNEWIKDTSHQDIPNFYRHMYLLDCQAMISTIQNLLSGMEYSFVNYYSMITKINLKTESGGDDVFICISERVRAISSLIESYFIKAYSVLDMVCKILFEFQNKQEDFTKYQKLKSANRLWGDRKRLVLDDYFDTVFDNCQIVSMIESLRNEVIHNGSWEQNPKVFLKVQSGKIVERYMLFPDISQGRLSTSKNRKRFFSLKTKVNDVLPDIHFEFQKRLLRTIELINSKYSV